MDLNRVSLLQKALIEKSRRVSGDTLYNFLRASWPVIEPNQPFVAGKHIEAICEHLEAVRRGQIRNLLINVPPRHCKSSIVSVAYPAWVWREIPGHKFIYASHSFSLSKRDSVKCRSLIQSEWYRNKFQIKWEISDDQNEKVKFENTEKGFRMAASVGGSVIGTGADTQVVDDPHSPLDVRSETVRQSVIDWYDQEFSTRINDPKTASRIMIMQRLDQQDLSQHVLDKGGWTHLMLPAQYEEARKCVVHVTGWEDERKIEGEPLWPERFGTPEIEDFKRSLGSMAAAGQLQQRPAPAEGAIFKRAWFTKFHVELPELEFIGMSVDLTFKEGKKNDYADFAIWARAGAMRYHLDRIRGQMGFNEQINAFLALVAKWNPQAKWVEDTANGPALIAALRTRVTGIIPVKPKGSKIARAEAVTPIFEAGNISLPDPLKTPWVSDYIEEMCTFPGGMHDDQVDTTTQALSQMALRPSIVFDTEQMSITGPSKWLR